VESSHGTGRAKATARKAKPAETAGAGRLASSRTPIVENCRRRGLPSSRTAIVEAACVGLGSLARPSAAIQTVTRSVSEEISVSSVSNGLAGSRRTLPEKQISAHLQCRWFPAVRGPSFQNEQTQSTGTMTGSTQRIPRKTLLERPDKQHRSQSRVTPLLLTLAVGAALCGNGPARTAVAGDEPGGRVKGTVTYGPDPDRPWRYARHFIRDPQSPELAEAVVALRAPVLRNWSDSGEPKTVEMDQQFFQFKPQTLAIREGDTVRFLNSDATTHNVRARSPLARFSENIAPQFNFEHQFERAGGVARPIQIGCAFHGGMRAWVLVFDHPFFTVTKADGTFEFDAVPPGRYRLDVYHPEGNLRRSRTIEVKAGDIVTESVELTPDHRLK